MSRPRLLALAAGPAAAMLCVWPFAEAGAHGLFQVDVGGLAAMATLAAFAWRPRRDRTVLVVLALVPVLLVHLLAGGAFASTLPFTVLLLGVAGAAAGVAALGRRLGAPAFGASALAVAVPVVGMLGLFWADPLGDRLPREKRFAFKQAVVHLDAATATALDVAAFDRFHDDKRVYAEVRLATEAVHPPAALPTGLAWLALGLVAAGVAAVVPSRREVA